jgi:two-component system response regulator AtoC
MSHDHTTHVITRQHADVAPAPRAPRRATSVLLVGSTTVGFALRDGAPVVIGRSSPADVVCDDASLSRLHARLTWHEDGIEIEDLRSTNGTFINSRRIERARAAGEDSILLGGVAVHLHLPAVRDTNAPAEDMLEFTRHVASEIVRAKTFRRPLALVAARRVGNHGSGAWESLVRAAVRPVDRVVSAGSDVLLVALSETPATALREWAERLQAAAPTPLLLGAAMYPEHASEEETLIAKALRTTRVQRNAGELVLATSSVAAPAQPAGVVVESPGMQRLYDLVARVARTTLPVLVRGETGVGKELIATELHARSARASGPIKAVNCAAIPANLTESVLFGHEKGAFTGATARAAGIFEQAHGGTVFLDEIGELPPQAQAALLRVLETRRVTRVGGAQDFGVDVRVVAATHRDLEAMVAEGTFRADLLYRLDAFTLDVPPLRERPEDVLPLASMFLSAAMARWGTPQLELAEAVRDVLVAYAWPGNVRQLRNTVERAAAIAIGPSVTLADLPRALTSAAPRDDERSTIAGASRAPVISASSAASLTERVESFEREVIREAMLWTSGNQSHAAELLRVPRRTLAHKVKRYGLG